MLKGAIVSAIVLAVGMTSLAQAEPGDVQARTESAVPSGPVIKESHIARLRSALNLTPAQQRHWYPVEAALRQLARAQSRDEGGSGLVQRMSDRAASVAGTAVGLRRLASAAAPLIRVLDDSQKRDAMSFAHSAGFGQLAAAF